MTALLVRTRGPSRPWRTSGPSPGPTIPLELRDATSDRARRILGTEIEYIPHPSFDDPGAPDAILGPMPAPANGQAPRRTSAPKGVPAYLVGLYDVPLLSREQEVHLFRKMNYLMLLAERARARLDPARAEARDLEEFIRLHDEAVAIRAQIVRANLRLVISIAKRHAGPQDDLFERVSDGNVALIRAVARFDYARGNKFSTYASWAIINCLRRKNRAKNNRVRVVTGHAMTLQTATDTRADEHDQEELHQQRQGQVERWLGRLNDRERRILACRYGLGEAEEKTLRQIGKELGITKERVRQIETRAKAKLLQFARTEERARSIA